MLRNIDPLMGVLNSYITLFCAGSARNTRFQIHLTFVEANGKSNIKSFMGANIRPFHVWKAMILYFLLRA